jgi:hypothetical protein
LTDPADSVTSSTKDTDTLIRQSLPPSLFLSSDKFSNYDLSDLGDATGDRSIAYYIT